jgi:hypothetical protein
MSNMNKLCLLLDEDRHIVTSCCGFSSCFHTTLFRLLHFLSFDIDLWSLAWRCATILQCVMYYHDLQVTFYIKVKCFFFDFWGHFRVRDIAFFIIPHRFMIFGMNMNYHQAVCLVSACSTLDLNLWYQGQDNRCEFRSQLPHLIIFKQCILFPPGYVRRII